MRILVAALAAALAACTPPDAPQPADPADAAVAAAPFAMESEALVGLWSFERHCGDYDLVFAADGGAEHHVVSAEGMATSYAGAWTTADNNRVVLTLQRLDANGARSGEAITYNLDVAAPVTDDLVGHFARADGAEARAINARRCPEEDSRLSAAHAQAGARPGFHLIEQPTLGFCAPATAWPASVAASAARKSAPSASPRPGRVSSNCP
jgi:hypothetical protein